MSIRDKIADDYFEWLYDRVCRGRFARGISYRKLLMKLHDMPFRFTIPKDENRADDGMDLRYRFALSRHDESIADYLRGPCSVLEMMIALAIRCEEDIMDDHAYGDRTGQWFWGMVNNLGLGSMHNDRYDRWKIEDAVNRFLDREYSPDGRGGLFYVRHCDQDLRDVEIWRQANWYLHTFM